MWKGVAVDYVNQQFPWNPLVWFQIRGLTAFWKILIPRHPFLFPAHICADTTSFCRLYSPAMTLVELPPEILVNIYCNLSSVKEAIHLAQTCSAASAVLKHSVGCKKIFQSIISSESGRGGNSNLGGNILSKAIYSYHLRELTSKQIWTKFAATCCLIGRLHVIPLMQSRSLSSCHNSKVSKATRLWIPSSSKARDIRASYY